MADAVTSLTIHDGRRWAIMGFTNQSDGTGESAVTKVDVSALADAPAFVTIEEIWYSTVGMAVAILWDATTDVLAFSVPADASDRQSFKSIGGLKNNAGSGVTGDLKFTTVGHSAGDSYSIRLLLRKAKTRAFA